MDLAKMAEAILTAGHAKPADPTHCDCGSSALVDLNGETYCTDCGDRVPSAAERVLIEQDARCPDCGAEPGSHTLLCTTGAREMFGDDFGVCVVCGYDGEGVEHDGESYRCTNQSWCELREARQARAQSDSCSGRES